MRRPILLLDLLLIFLFTALLIEPLFRANYLNRWDSIESAFIADGRFLNEHWPLYDDHQGDVIYQVRRYPSLARVVDTARLPCSR